MNKTHDIIITLGIDGKSRTSRTLITDEEILFSNVDVIKEKIKTMFVEIMENWDKSREKCSPVSMHDYYCDQIKRN